MLWVRHCKPKGPEGNNPQKWGFHVHLCTRTKRGLSRQPFIPKEGGGDYFLFIYLFYSPLRNASCTAGAISAALIRSPATSLCTAKISVGTQILTLIATMAANYKSARQYIVLIGKMLHESEYAWGHTHQVQFTVAQLVQREQTVLSWCGDRKSGNYSRASVFLWTEVLFWQRTRQSVFIDCCHFWRQEWAQVKSQICWQSCFIRL